MPDPYLRHWHGDEALDYPGHIAACDRACHYAFGLGVYDQHGQRVNELDVLVCDGTPVRDLDQILAEDSSLWPGLTLAAWVGDNAHPPAPPMKLSHGPTPDAIHNPRGA